MEDADQYKDLNPRYIDGKNVFFTTGSKEELNILVDKLQKFKQGRLDCNLYQGDITRQPRENKFEGSIEEDDFYQKCLEKRSLDYAFAKEEGELNTEAHILNKLDGMTMSASGHKKRKNKKKTQKKKIKGIIRRDLN